MDINWSQYVSRVASGTLQQIADRTGIAKSTINRWLNDPNSTPSATQAAQFARGYGENPVTAFIAAGFFTQQEASHSDSTAVALRNATDLELAQETVRRVQERGSQILESPLDADHPALGA